MKLFINGLVVVLSTVIFSASAVFAGEKNDATHDLAKDVDGVKALVVKIEQKIDGMSKEQGSDAETGERKDLYQKMMDLSDRMKDSAKKYRKIQRVRDRWDWEFESGWRHFEEKDEPLLPGKWLFVGLTLRGVLSENRGVSEKLGAEAGVSLPVLRGIDLGAGFGSFFQKGGKIHKDVRGRIFLTRIRRGLYLGGGTIYDPKNVPYGTIGWSGSHLFAELDFRKGDSAPVTTVPQFGLRFRI